MGCNSYTVSELILLRYLIHPIYIHIVLIDTFHDIVFIIHVHALTVIQYHVNETIFCIWTFVTF
jgi:hypothetical protein